VAWDPPARADRRLEMLLDRQDLGDRAADQQVAHDRGGGPAHRAADRLVGQGGHPQLLAATPEMQEQGDLVTAGGTAVMDLRVERLTPSGVQGTRVVLHHQYGVEGSEGAGHHRVLKNSTVRDTPSIRASTSVGVVWTEKLARVVPWIPNRRCNGQAQ